MPKLKPWHSFLLFLLALTPPIVQAWRRQNPVPGRLITSRFRDFYEFFSAAEVLHRGGSAHEVFSAGLLGYLYPPLLATLISPLTPLGIFLCARLWLVLCILCVIASAYLISRDAIRQYWPDRAPLNPRSLAWLLSAGVALLLIDRMTAELKMQQSNTLMLLCWCVAAVTCSRRPWLAGLALAIGFNIKFVTLFALPYLLLRGHFRAAGWFIILTLAIALATAIPLGHQLNADLWQGTLKGLVGASSDAPAATLPSAIDSDDPLPSTTTASRVFSMDRFGVSLTTALLRLTSDLGHPQLGWPLAFAAALLYLALLAALYHHHGLSFLTGKSRSNLPPPSFLPALEWALVILLMLAFSPQTNPRHFVQLLLTYIYLAPLILILPTNRQRLTALACLVLMAISLSFPPGGNKTQLAALWSNSAAACIANLLLYLPLLHLALKSPRNNPAPPAIHS
jgi:hypothetical protein